MEFTSLWNEASEDLVAEAAVRKLAVARSSAAGIWSFLAIARSPEEFEWRLEHAAEALYTHAGHDLTVYSELLDSLREDFDVLAKSKKKDKDEDDKKSKKDDNPMPWEDDDDDSMDDGDKDDDDKESEDDSDDDDDDEDDKKKGKGKKGNPFPKKADHQDMKGDSLWGHVETHHPDETQQLKDNPSDTRDWDHMLDEYHNEWHDPERGGKVGKTAAWIVIKEEGQRKVAGPFDSKPQALDVAKAKGPGYTVEQAGVESSLRQADMMMTPEQIAYRRGEMPTPTNKDFDWKSHTPQAVNGPSSTPEKPDNQHDCPVCGEGLR